LEKVGHPALSMEDMTHYAQSAETDVKQEKAPVAAPVAKAPEAAPATGALLDASAIEALKKSILAEVRAGLTQDIVRDIIGTLSSRFLGETLATPVAEKSVVAARVEAKPSAAERLSKVSSFQIRKEKSDATLWEVKLGATKAEGGTRTITHKIGGASAMPFHFWEGAMPNRPLVAMEVYDLVSPKYPAILRNIYGNLLDNPAAMAKVLVEQYGADIISVRLEGTHPEKGNRSVEDSVKLVKQVLSAVGVPLIITGHSHYEKNNEVLKAVAQACAGENLLLNWVDQDNYRTLAGAAMAYGHTLVAQSPIDVNIGKQLNILLTNMDLKKEQIVMDPMTGAIGYGIEYTYSVMERIRQTALGGDKLLCAPMIVSPGQECIKIKEYKATEKEFPLWGDLAKRAAAWELDTAINLLYAGADVEIMYHPEAAMAMKRTIAKLMAN
jgi:acetyl-CoA decarbonylase/synthase complex subunit delta